MNTGKYNFASGKPNLIRQKKRRQLKINLFVLKVSQSQT